MLLTDVMVACDLQLTMTLKRASDLQPFRAT